MELKLRSVPKDVFTMMGLNENFNYNWTSDPVSSLIGLGTSYLLEFFEFYGDSISKYYNRFVKDTEFEDERYPQFISQERRHAAAHKNLNLFMAKNYLPPSREKHHPRVYDFLYPTYKDFVEPIIEGIATDEEAGLTLKSPHFQEAIKSIGIFESEVCMAGISFYDNLIDNGRLEYMMKLSDNIGVLYLLGYHYAEEMEHCSVSIETYEAMYKEKLWTKERVEKYLDDSDMLSKRIVTATLFVAKMLNVDITVKQITDRMSYQRRMQNRKSPIKEGFNATEPEILKKREYFVQKWDNEWEPMLLEKIRQHINENSAVLS